MLTRYDRRGGALHHVIGERADGSRVVLESFLERSLADDQAKRFRGMLEDYQAILVESDDSEPWTTKGKHHENMPLR